MEGKRLIPRIILGIALCMMVVGPASADLKVVSTTSVLWEPIQYIGGDHVEAIYIADPTVCPHMQGEIINNRIQLERDFISEADLFVAHNFTVDNPHVMPYVEEFMDANGYGEVQWTTMSNPSMPWAIPENAHLLAKEITGWLVGADPDNAAYYEERSLEYRALIDAVDLTEDEKELIAGQDAIVIVWQQDAAENWLGLNVVNIYAPEFYMGGKYTAAKLVDDIIANTSNYENVQYIIENMQSGEMAKGVEEALQDRGIPVKRVVFTNFPKSIQGVNSLPDVIAYNKELVTPEEPAPPETTQTQATPMGLISLAGAFIILAAIVSRRH
jgi:zinc/manganese transport system substrate-binding protein